MGYALGFVAMVTVNDESVVIVVASFSVLSSVKTAKKGENWYETKWMVVAFIVDKLIFRR